MASVLIGANLVLGTLTVLNFVISVGVVQRLRVHTEVLSRIGGQAPTLRPGDPIGPFKAESIKGTVISDEMINSESTIGFFSPGCGPCKERLPDFLKFTQEMSAVHQHRIAVIVGHEDESAELVAAIGEGSMVVLEEEGGSLVSACQIEAFPTFLVVERSAEGLLEVRASGIDLSAIRERVS